MSSFDLMPDAPGLLRAESINITLKFERTSATTGRVSWNIPTPATGCAADQQAYCGMLVVLDTKPSTIDKIPTNGTVYSSDPTADANLFAGDKLSTSLVIGAFYNDRTTTMFDVSGIMANTPYYVTGFPMDCQYRYFIEGVHAYSTEYINRGTDDTRGTQIVVLNSNQATMGAKPTDATGLADNRDYTFSIQLGVDPNPERALDSVECKLAAPTYNITIHGADAQTYEELVAAINIELSKLQQSVQGPVPPSAGGYYWNNASKKLYQWNGYTHIEIPVIVDATIPNALTPGFFWLNPTTNVMSMWNGAAWVITTVIETPFDPKTPTADSSYWFDGTTARLWNGATWCDLVTYIQTTDPSAAVNPPEGTYWYNEAQLVLMKWNSALEMWFTADVVQSANDPTNLPVGTYWFNIMTNVLSSYNTPNTGWNAISNVSISENAPLTPAPGKYWYNPTSEQLFQRDLLNTTWTELDVITHQEDPTIHGSCDLWWNTATDLLYVWDNLTSAWVAAANFIQQSTDPSQAPVIVDGAAWYDPSTGKLYIYENNCFTEVKFINWPTDPRANLTPGIVWHNTATNKWYLLDIDSNWSEISFLVNVADPSTLAAGTFWFNTATQGLSIWNGAAWVNVSYSLTPFTPTINTLWYDTVANLLMTWNGITWVTATPYATVELDCHGNLLFTDTAYGSTSLVRLKDGTLFSALGPFPAAIHDMHPGSDGASNKPSYDELGIGTDGSDGPRNSLINEIRYELGYPVVNIELTKDQMDYAVTRSLEELRQKSSLGYKRGFFFMVIIPEQQKYFLTNKIQGMNKIVDILGIYRLTSAFLSSAHGAGVYGQIVLQHMYNMGTFDLLSFHLMAEYTSLLEILFAARITFSWNEQTRMLWIHHRFPQSENAVAIEATVERTEQDILTDRYAKTWIRRYAAATCRLMLAEIRGKFSSLPGAGGAVTLNATDLRQAAQTEIDALLLEIKDFVADRPEEWGTGTTFIFG